MNKKNEQYSNGDLAACIDALRVQFNNNTADVQRVVAATAQAVAYATDVEEVKWVVQEKGGFLLGKPDGHRVSAQDTQQIIAICESLRRFIKSGEEPVVDFRAEGNAVRTMCKNATDALENPEGLKMMEYWRGWVQSHPTSLTYAGFQAATLDEQARLKTLASSRRKEKKQAAAAVTGPYAKGFSGASARIDAATVLVKDNGIEDAEAARCAAAIEELLAAMAAFSKAAGI